MEELIFINEDYFYERFGESSDDKHFFYGKIYLVNELSGNLYEINNPRVKKSRFFPCQLLKRDVDKLFCTKIEFRKYKLRQLNQLK